MSDPQTWPSLANGDASGVHESPPPPNPHPSDIKDESWGRAEEATGEVLRCIRPTVVSEERRKAVVDYVQLLLRTRTSTAVFPFGSVPLKTYLPDGDIDLTTLGLPSNEDNLASEVCSVLGEEEQNSDAEFEVKDVQLIRAEVKLVKCIVQNIVVDISFNQIGGLCTLCFLEKVDQKIGNDHLVKRSIILIKAWCYYESRILGAHHGLISTYALEILVLYVFHLFHDYLDGPLAVLYRFLDYYSKFDWDKYCISLQGPISISSLPNLVVEPLETNGSCSLLTEEFIKECVDKFSVPSRVYGNNYQVFAQKHLNIVDPLKRNNNLGRSVSKGNFYRIRSAFTYGARKLGRILLLPSESIADEINLFFKSTLDRHGGGDRPDVQDAASSCPKTRNDVTIDHNVMGSSSNLNAEDGHEDSQFSGSLAGGSNGILVDDINNIKISDMGQENTSKKHDKHSFSTFVANRLDDCSKIDSIIPEEEFPESAKDDARDFALERAFDSRSLGDNFKASTSGKAHHDPHFFFHLENVSEDDKNGNSSSVDSGTVSVPSRSSITPLEEIRYDSKSSSSTSLRKSALIAPASAINEPSPSSGNSYLSEHSSFHECSNDGNLNNASATCTNLSDLSGDYSLYCRNLEHSREFQECVSSPYLAPVYQTSQFQNKQSWSMPNIYSHVGVNGLVHMPPFPPSCYLLQPVIPNDYGTKDITKTRGTGTYLPNTNSRSYKERQPAGRVKNQIHTNTNQFPRYRKNGYGDSPNHGVSSEERNHGPSLQPQIPISVENGHDKLIPSDVPQPSAAFVILSPKNGFPYPSSGKLEFGSLGAVAVGVSSPGRGRNFESPNVVGRGPAPVIPESAVENPHKSWNHERINKPYQLKDDDDFPPLIG